MLSPETFARVIAARGDAARPRYTDTQLFRSISERWVFKEFMSAGYCASDAEAHNACALHWLGMEAEAKWNLNAYFVDGKVDIEALAAAVIEHAKESP